MIFLILLISLPVQAFGAQVGVELAKINIEHGLSSPNLGDGQTVAVFMNSRECRKNDPEATPESHFMYFDIDSEIFGHPLNPVYVTVDYLDSGFGSFHIQYDSRDETAPERSAYKVGSEELLLNSGEWRTVTFELPDPKFDGRQSNDADFRLVSTGNLHVAKITVDTARPEGYTLQAQSSAERLKVRMGGLQPAKGVRIVISGYEHFSPKNAAAAYDHIRRIAPLLKALGASSVLTYCRWDVVEPIPGTWNWDFYDGLVEILKQNDLKWTPLLAAGQAFSTPDWFRMSKDSVLSQCVEHNTQSKVQSPWNPTSSKWVSGFINQFASHYKDNPTIDGVILGVQGDTCRMSYSSVQNGWVQELCGNYHSHTGMWCGDKYAKADFLHYLKGRYKGADRVNQAWKTRYKSIEEVAPFTFEDRPSDAAWLDELAWYRGRMNRIAEVWLTEARRVMPETSIYLCVEPSIQPEFGIDISALVKTAGRNNAGIWMIQDGAGYPLDFALLRLPTSAAKFYKAHLAVESSGKLDASNELSRAYNSVCSSISTICEREKNLVGVSEVIDSWKSGIEILKPSYSNVAAAVFCPTSSLGPGNEGLLDKLTAMRDCFDYDILDERMIQDGALKNYRALVWLPVETVTEKTAAAVTEWVHQGGMIVVSNSTKIKTFEKGVDLSKVFLPEQRTQTSSRTVGMGASLRLGSDWQNVADVVRDLSRVLDTLSSTAGRTIVPDGEVDQIYITDLGSSLLIFNAGQSKVERELETSIGRHTKVTIPARSVIEIPLQVVGTNTENGNANKLQ